MRLLADDREQFYVPMRTLAGARFNKKTLLS